MNDRKFPLVSVIITTYKRSDLLSRAIHSVLAQDYKNIEILVVDDNDPDTEFRRQTETVMDEFSNESKVHYIKHEKNKNGAAARNTGIKNAEGKYVTYLDDDDMYRPQKVSKQVDYLLNHPKFDAVYCGWNKDNKEETPKVEGDISFEILSGDLLIRTNTIMMDRQISIDIGGWNEKYRRNQEAVYLLRFFNDNKFIGAVPEVLVDFDSSDRSNASNPQQNEEDFAYFLSDHNETIERTARADDQNKKIIYSKRYRGVFLTYLKNKEFKEAFRIYMKCLKNIPIRFHIDMIQHTLYKINESVSRS